MLSIKRAKETAVRAALVLFVLFVALAIGAANTKSTAKANDIMHETVGGITYGYYINSSGEYSAATITSVDLNGKTECVIPETVGGAKVCSIAKGVFAGNTEVTKIALPDGMTSIPAFSFDGCTSLKELDLNRVTGFSSVIRGGYVYQVPGEMPALETISVADDNRELCVYDGVLMTKKGKGRIVCYPSADPRTRYEIPSFITGFANGSFISTQNLKEIAVNENMTQDELSIAFINCDSITAVDLGMVSRKVCVDAKFSGLKVKEFKADPENTFYTAVDGVLYSKDMTTLYAYPVRKEQSSFTVPEGVKEIGASAFEGSLLEEFILPRSLTRLRYNSFAYCANLKSITIPNNVGGIANNAFYECTSLEEIVIPPHTNSIGDSLAELDAVIKGEEGSYAEKWASEHRMPFKPVTIERYDQDIVCDMEEKTIDLVCGEAPKCIEVSAKTPIELKVSDDSVASASEIESGYVEIKPVGAGTATLTVKAERTDVFKSDEINMTVKVTKKEPIGVAKMGQMISVAPSVKGVCGQTASLDAAASTALTYESSSPAVISVSRGGKVQFLKPGSAKVEITAAATDKYYGARKTVTVSSTLARPNVKLTLKKGKTKIAWKRIPGATQMQVYVKYPGKKKFKLAVTKPAKVVSVTHKGLTRGKTYSYKVRARTKVGGKYYYSKFSKAKKVRAR